MKKHIAAFILWIKEIKPLIYVAKTLIAVIMLITFFNFTFLM